MSGELASGGGAADAVRASRVVAILRLRDLLDLLDDAARATWDAYAARAWPTLVLVDPAGYIAAQVTGAHALVVGHPFIDIWQAVKPSVVGIRAWPTVPSTGSARASPRFTAPKPSQTFTSISKNWRRRSRSP